ncbi:MAG TPA: hypothetical protein PLN81_12970 [Bacillota bacterium]|nr:hypothetical protein [Bacillota bacterium]
MLKTKFVWRGKLASETVRQAALEGCFEAGEELLRVANAMCPHDTGTLMRSGEVTTHIGRAESSTSGGVVRTEDPRLPAGKTEIKVHVDYDTPYAVRLHEHPEYNFQKGRRGKWLEAGLRKVQPRLQSHIQAKVQSVLG